jgi:hypothetical protein
MSVIIQERDSKVSTSNMELQINSNRYLWEIQKDFSAEFGYLKIEFFSKPQLSERPFTAKNIFSNQRRISDLAKSSIDSTIKIDERMSVSELERVFSDQFSLSVQVFRRSGNIWLETTMTDGWSLKQQNEHGKEITIKRLL